MHETSLSAPDDGLSTIGAGDTSYYSFNVTGETQSFPTSRSPLASVSMDARRRHEKGKSVEQRKVRDVRLVATGQIGLGAPVDRADLRRGDRPEAGRCVKPLEGERPPRTVTRGWDALFLDAIPGARGQPHATIEGAGHFLQEDAAAELAARLIDFMRAR